jgi:hypothetical protein
MNSHIWQIIRAHGLGAFTGTAWNDAGQQRPGSCALLARLGGRRERAARE